MLSHGQELRAQPCQTTPPHLPYSSTKPTTYNLNHIFAAFLATSHCNGANALHPTLDNRLDAYWRSAMANYRLSSSQPDASRK